MFQRTNGAKRNDVKACVMITNREERSKDDDDSATLIGERCYSDLARKKQAPRRTLVARCLAKR